MSSVAARQGMLAGAVMLVCAACAPTTYTKPGISQSQSERDLEACRLEGEARTTETLPHFGDYRVEVSAFEPGPYTLETRMRFAAQDAAESRYRAYFDEQVRAYVAPCMERKGYNKLGQLLQSPLGVDHGQNRTAS